jgi:predicted transcriptional regulator
MLTQSNILVLAAAIRAGRGALNWSQNDLAEKSGVSLPTVARLEATIGSPKLETVGKLLGAIEKAGVKYDWSQPTGFVMTLTVKKTAGVGKS